MAQNETFFATVAQVMPALLIAILIEATSLLRAVSEYATRMWAVCAALSGLVTTYVLVVVMFFVGEGLSLLVLFVPGLGDRLGSTASVIVWASLTVLTLVAFGLAGLWYLIWTRVVYERIVKRQRERIANRQQAAALDRLTFLRSEHVRRVARRAFRYSALKDSGAASLRVKWAYRRFVKAVIKAWPYTGEPEFMLDVQKLLAFPDELKRRMRLPTAVLTPDGS
ncbi:hypothetical protein AB0M43_24115 [Longispora sp. NPDC051575]|uniref:hypothetical protein n=1 Tax=Longispora sp. NPDC051575 TaxID=3154943 RepID=UPI0034263FCC